MKTNILNLAAAALLIFAASSCNKEQIVNTGDGTKAVALSLSFGDAGTKAFNPDEPYEGNFGTFGNLDIYFTNAAGNILYHWSASSDDVSGNSGIIWNGLIGNDPVNQPGNGVKFMGLSTDVTGVYVVANGPKIITTDDGQQDGTINIQNISEGINMLLTDYAPSEEQENMPYVGGDKTLTNTSDPSDLAGIVPEGATDESGVYVEAQIFLRPAISRIEIQKVGIKQSGIEYFTVAEDGTLTKSASAPEQGEYYSVAWDNFNAELVGVYMSNVYRQAKLFPVSNSIDNWGNESGNLFATPGFANGESPILNGKWNALTEDFNNILAYSGHNGSSYESVVPDGYGGTMEDNNKWLFEGANSTAINSGIIPFNFFVPYNVTDDSENNENVGPIDGTEYPRLHFQFLEATSSDYYFEVKHHTTQNTEGEEVTEGDIFNALSLVFNLPSAIGDPTVYANVSKFATNPNVSESDVIIKPGYIYQVKEVLVSPSVLAATPSDDDMFNVIVEVRVVPFNTKNVYPIFD